MAGKINSGAMNWLRLESKIREAVQNVVRDGNGDAWKVSQAQAMCTIMLINEIIGEETGRGYPIRDDGSMGV